MKGTKNKYMRSINKYRKCLLILIAGSVVLFITFNMVDNIWKIFLQTISSYIIVSCLLDILKNMLQMKN